VAGAKVVLGFLPEPLEDSCCTRRGCSCSRFGVGIVDRHLTDQGRRVVIFDAMETDNARRAAAIGIPAIEVDCPVAFAIADRQEVPVGWKEIVIGQHRGARSGQRSLGSGLSVPLVRNAFSTAPKTRKLLT
jgi:hypothetical protein